MDKPFSAVTHLIPAQTLTLTLTLQPKMRTRRGREDGDGEKGSKKGEVEINLRIDNAPARLRYLEDTTSYLVETVHV